MMQGRCWRARSPSSLCLVLVPRVHRLVHRAADLLHDLLAATPSLVVIATVFRPTPSSTIFRDVVRCFAPLEVRAVIAPGALASVGPSSERAGSRGASSRLLLRTAVRTIHASGFALAGCTFGCVRDATAPCAPRLPVTSRGIAFAAACVVAGVACAACALAHLHIRGVT